MREIHIEEISGAVARLCQEANFFLPQDIIDALRQAIEREESALGQDNLRLLLENAQIARERLLPLCQDCGFAVVFLEIGQDLHVVGGDLYSAIHEGVRKGYREGFLRASIAASPVFERINTRDNTPAAIHAEIVPGDRLRIRLMPKGGGCENVGALAILTPAQGAQGAKDFVVRTVEKAGPNPCPPIIVGVGMGGTMDTVTLLAKKALFRRVGEPHPDPQIAALERELLDTVNALGIGPLGFGGRTTALAVHIETYPAHITALPVAVNIQCHSARQKETMI